MKQIFIFFILLIPCCTKAQTAEDSVKMVIDRLFTAMKNSDDSLLFTCFADSAILQTISKDKKGNIIVKQENLKDFGISISMAPKGSLDERIRYDVVKTDGPLATAWTPYSFYYQEKFSHCGVNSFQLIKTSNGWKIQYLIDTRRRAGCE